MKRFWPRFFFMLFILAFGIVLGIEIGGQKTVNVAELTRDISAEIGADISGKLVKLGDKVKDDLKSIGQQDSDPDVEPFYISRIENGEIIITPNYLYREPNRSRSQVQTQDPVGMKEGISGAGKNSSAGTDQGNSEFASESSHVLNANNFELEEIEYMTSERDMVADGSLSRVGNRMGSLFTKWTRQVMEKMFSFML